MERVLVGLALAVAGAMVVWSLAGEDGLQFRIDADDGFRAEAPSLSIGQPDGEAIQSTPYAVTRLRIEDAAAIVTIIPEERADIAVSVSGGERLPPIVARLEGDRLVLDGGLDRRVRRCDTVAFSDDGQGQERFSIRVAEIGDVARAEMPRVTIRAPRALDYEASGAVVSEIGETASARLAFDGCGPAKVAIVEGALDLRVAGSGDVRAAAAATAKVAVSGSAEVALGAVSDRATVSIAGSGDVTVGPVGGGLEASIAGSGDLAAGQVAGPLTVSIAGSGDVSIGGGEPGPVKVSIAGSGGVTVAGAVRGLDASIMGSGSVHVGRVNGALERSVMGSGDVIVGR